VASETALSFLSAFFPPAHAFKALKDQFSTAARFARAEYLLKAFSAKLNRIESEVQGQRENLESMRVRIESIEFKQAMAVCFCASRTTHRPK
jgi:hypothetical protein